jgi:LacI family transcriptional regulator
VRATLSSVARLAGVSTSTASRALTGDPKVAPDTRRRVLDAAGSLRYRPNRIASGLRTRRTGLVAFALPDLRDPWWAGVTEALQAAAAQDGVQVLTQVTGRSADAEASLVAAALEFGFDAVVIGSRTDVGEHLRQVVDARVKVVTIGGVHPGGLVPAVLPDHGEAVRLLTAHLIELGHRRIACLPGEDGDQATRDAHAGFLRALAEAGVPLRGEWVLTGERTAGFGASAVTRLGLDLSAASGSAASGSAASGSAASGSAAGTRSAGDGPPTAVVAGSWFTATGVAQRVTGLGLRLGADVSLVLSEGTPAPFEGWSGPALTSVESQVDDVARAAWAAVSPAARGDAPHGDAAQGDAAQGDAAHRDAARGDVIRGDVIRLAPTPAPGSTSGPPPSGPPMSGPPTSPR